MLASSAPTKVPVPFAESGARNTIPATSQVSITPGAASLPDGFPPLTRTPIAAGGVPPFGQDMNGILWLVSAWSRWNAAGGAVFYDAAFSSAIGGYPKGATLASVSAPGQFWVSASDNNTSNPDTGGANWLASASLFGVNLTVFRTPGAATFTPRASVTSYGYLVIGGGGGGGAATVSGAAGSGAGGGGVVLGIATGVTSSVAISVGSGGTGSSSSANGSAGGSSSFGTSGSATGGGGGFTSGGGGQGTVGSAGVGSGGLLSLPGQTGGTGQVVGSAMLGGTGGGSAISPGVSPSTSAGGNGAALGGGGGGGANNGAGGGIGGNGAPGLVLVWG